MNEERIKFILEEHKKWLDNKLSGTCADFTGANLSGINLKGAELRRACFKGANLSGADLSHTDLRDVDLSCSNLSNARLRNSCLLLANLNSADLRNADLSRVGLNGATLKHANLRNANLTFSFLGGTDLGDVDLRDANLINADLRGAHPWYTNLHGAKLSGADLREVLWNANTLFFGMSCPSDGAFTGWKQCSKYIVKLWIPDDAKRSSATTRKCRCSKAYVLEIQKVNGTIADVSEIASDRDQSFIYKTGEWVKVENFDEDRWNECSTGIHFFVTREEAIFYQQ